MLNRLMVLSGVFVLLAASVARSKDETREAKIDDLKLTVPASWKQQTVQQSAARSV